MASKNGISRVVLIYQPENFLSAVKAYQEALNITDFEGPYEFQQVGLKVVKSWDTGVEIISPLPEGGYSGYLRDFLKSKGEGMFNLIYRVNNLQSAESHAAAHGYPPVGDCQDALEVHKEWRKRFTMLKELPLSPIAGVPVTLVQAEVVDDRQT